MQVLSPLYGLEFNDRRPHATSLAPSLAARIVRFTLRAGQSLRTHDALESYVYLFVVKGEGLFEGVSEPRRVRGCAIVVINPGETYSVQALEDLVFVAVRDHAVLESPHHRRELAGAGA
jgi:quercetin dioxygenase-like cupin family protein